MSSEGGMHRRGIPDRWFLRIAFCLTIAGLVAAVYAIAAGSTLLSGMAVMTTGLASLIPDILDYRRSKRLPTVTASIPRPIRPETWWNVGIEHDLSGDLPPGRPTVIVERPSHTIH